ncbi:ribonuclease P protein component [Candidatus Collierbacteria bacterium]|nr:ribonuclease P protein component [Candidatus Collierbacteria bacterium]
MPKAGIIVSKKLSNKAVVRNKLKRRLRAALQAVLPEIHSEPHLVVLPNRRALNTSVGELESELRSILTI